jgi:hypothetical protein
MRRIDKCMNCGDERELVSHGLCAKCYMEQRREAEKRDEPSWASPDRSERRYIAERNKMLVNLTRINKLVDETPCLSPEDAQAIKTVIRPYMLERVESLAPKPQVNTLTHQSELTTVNSAQVNESTSQGELTTNSEHQSVWSVLSFNPNKNQMRILTRVLKKLNLTTFELRKTRLWVNLAAPDHERESERLRDAMCIKTDDATETLWIKIDNALSKLDPVPDDVVLDEGDDEEEDDAA